MDGRCRFGIDIAWTALNCPYWKWIGDPGPLTKGNEMKQPNVVFILADDMGYGDFACFNYGLTQTPRLDALLPESVCLTQHYSGSALCAPARAAMRGWSTPSP